MASQHVIAVDLGAESGRVMLVSFDGSSLRLEEVHRFANVPVWVQETLYWDVLRLWHDITTGIEAAPPGAASIGVDSWGVDFALFDRDGRLLANPVHYRDKRTDGMMEWVFERVSRRTVFERTGIQFMKINGLYQIASLVRDDSPLLDLAATFLTIVDVFNYWLSGSRTCEFTHATTQQCYDPRLGDWDRATLAALGIPTGIFPPVVPPGTRLGRYQGIPVIAPVCHDTGSAVVAVPTTTPNYAYISSGTWSPVGMEVDEPIINDATYEANLTNEGGIGGTFRLLKNVMGLWLVQQCRATWAAMGKTYGYDDLTTLAVDAAPFRSLVDPDDPSFLLPGDMPARIRAFCQRTEQPVPESDGQVIRTVYESLALKYRAVLDRLIALTGRTVERVHIIGGGSQNGLLCQMTASAIGCPVVAGPVEATALGNAIVQYIALGELAGMAQAREFLSHATPLTVYEPQDGAAWTEGYRRFEALLTSI
jgi:rhamnulokinase